MVVVIYRYTYSVVIFTRLLIFFQWTVLTISYASTVLDYSTHLQYSRYSNIYNLIKCKTTKQILNTNYFYYKIGITGTKFSFGLMKLVKIRTQKNIGIPLR
jgi:hypothetical protein